VIKESFLDVVEIPSSSIRSVSTRNDRLIFFMRASSLARSRIIESIVRSIFISIPI
jgi:hypothetical protein